MYLYYHGHLSATWCQKVSPWANKMLLRGSIWSHWLKTKNGNSMWVMHLMKYSTTFAFSQWKAWHQMFGPCWVSRVTGRLLKPTPQLTMMDIKVILDSETIAAHGNGFDGEELDKVPILYVFPVLWTVCNTPGYAYYIQLNTAVTFRWLCCLHL